MTTSILAVTKAVTDVKIELNEMKRLSERNVIDRFVPVMEVRALRFLPNTALHVLTCALFQYFVAEAEPAIEALTAMSKQLEKDLWELLRFFGEDPVTVKPEDVFTTISSFALSLQVNT